MYGQQPVTHDALSEPNADMALYTLTNLQVVKDQFGQTAFSVDYQCIRNGVEKNLDFFDPIRVAGRTDKGDFEDHLIAVEKIGQSGTIQVRFPAAGPLDKGIEIYFLTTRVRTHLARRFLVSNSVIHGSMKSTLPTITVEKPEINSVPKPASESKPVEPLQVLPAEVPAGYSRVEFSTFLIPGTPVMYARDGKWQPGELVDKDGDLMTVLPSNGSRVFRFQDARWVAVDDEILAQVQEDANACTSNVFVSPESSLVLNDAVAAKGKDITKGMPLLFEEDERWCQGVFIQANDMMR